MGLLRNAAAAMIVRYENHRRNHFHIHNADVIPLDGKVIVCGGIKGRQNNKIGTYDLSMAEVIKLETFYQSVESAGKKRYGTVCVYSDYFPDPDIAEIQLDEKEIAWFGMNVSYDPLDSGNLCDDGIETVFNFFNRIIQPYCKRMPGVSSAVLCGCVRMLLSILYQGLGAAFVTYENLSILVKNMKKTQIDFQEYVRQSMDYAMDWENFLTLSWDDACRQFFPFWDNMCGVIVRKKVNYASSDSLYSALLNGKLCVMKLPANNLLLRDILFSELMLVHEKRCMYDFIDYYVPLTGMGEYRYLENAQSMMIGDSLRTLGIDDMPFVNPTIICLGLNPIDAHEMVEAMVATGNWIQTTFGIGLNGSHVTFTTADRKPVTESSFTIQSIRDGSAYRIDQRGFTFIRSLL